ncbi:MAG: universal stress protein [Gammaproteobacteria bacterium]|nr:MAG: universal stress protein [Gammaproteobacteria bacterium]
MTVLSAKHVLAPLDFSDPSMKSLDAAVELAKSYEGKVLIAYVAEPAPFSPELVVSADGYEKKVTEKAQKRLEEICQKHIADGVETSYQICFGNPYDEIIDLANSKQVDLIVMATHGHSGLRHLLIGSTTEKVVRAATCPVLTMKFSD